MSSYVASAWHLCQIVILGNLAAHQGEAIRHLVEARGWTLRFLPSSSPDLTRTLERRSPRSKRACAGQPHGGARWLPTPSERRWLP